MLKLVYSFFLGATLTGCALITAPVKVAGKVATKTATTTVKITGKAATAGVKAAIPNKEEKTDDEPLAE